MRGSKFCKKQSRMYSHIHLQSTFLKISSSLSIHLPLLTYAAHRVSARPREVLVFKSLLYRLKKNKMALQSSSRSPHLQKSSTTLNLCELLDQDAFPPQRSEPSGLLSCFLLSSSCWQYSSSP